MKRVHRILSPAAIKKKGIIVAGTPGSPAMIRKLNLDNRLAGTGDEGYIIMNTKYSNKEITVIAANKDSGVLYWTFRFLRLMQTHQMNMGHHYGPGPCVNRGKYLKFRICYF